MNDEQAQAIVFALMNLARAIDGLTNALMVRPDALPIETYREMTPPDRKHSAYHNPPPGES